MRSSPRLAIAATVALTLAGAAVVAVAQTPPTPPAPGQKMERQMMIHRGGPDGRMEPMRRSPEDRAERLRVLLQLTPNQDGALKAFVSATAPPEPEAFMRPTADARTPPTAVERADRAAEMAGKIAVEAKKRADATRAFYAALTPSQRKVFDTAPGAGGGMMMRIHDMRGPDGRGPGGRGPGDRGPGMRQPMPPMPPAPPPPPGA